MEVKGSALLPLADFIRLKHPDTFDKWLSSLPQKSHEIFSKSILSSQWYSLEEGLIIPIKYLCDLCYNGNKTGAWESGKFSAENSLKGIYKLFVKMGSPKFIIEKAATLLTTFYKPSEIVVKETAETFLLLHITKFPTPHELIEMRIGGWIEKALEISGCKKLSVKITKSLAKNDPVTEFTINWN